MVRHQHQPPRRVILAWSNISVSAPNPPTPALSFPFTKHQEQQWTPILTDVSGYCVSGELTAVMGASGAGKSTLLATVSQRACLHMEGELLLNSRQPTPDIMARVSGFVPQHDVVFPYLTVSEHITFMASLTMDRSMSRHERRCRIDHLLNELGLLRSRDTRLSSLSGGEMKRLSLAVHLLGDPALLFCDEPTTGLDSYSAGVVVQQLRRCADRGTAVLATIHQPASQHLHAFHRLMLLAAGRVAYSGPLQSAETYFTRLGMVCPPSFNVAEFYVKQLATSDSESLSHVKQLSRAFSASTAGQKEEKMVMQQVTQYYQQQMDAADSTADVLCDLLSHEQQCFDVLFHPSNKRRTANWLIRFYMVLWRGYKEVISEPIFLLIQYTSILLLGIMMSLAYSGVGGGSSGQNIVQDLEGLLALSVFFIYNSSSQKNFRTISKDMPILRREVSNGLYGPLPHYLSTVLIATACSVAENTVFCTLVFWATGLRGGFDGYLAFTLPVLLLALAATGFGVMMSACIESVDLLLVINAPLNIFFLFLSGFFGSLSSQPTFLRYFKYTSMFYYSLEAMSISQWRLVQHLDCWNNVDLPCLQNGTQVMEKYGYDSDNYTLDLLGLTLLCAITNTIGFVAFYLGCRQPATY